MAPAPAIVDCSSRCCRHYTTEIPFVTVNVFPVLTVNHWPLYPHVVDYERNL